MFFLSFADASSTNEAVHLQQRLKSLSSELVTLRNRLHVDNTNVDVTLTGDVTTGAAAAVNLVTSSNTTNLTNGPFVNHSNMQIGSSAIPITNKSNPKVSTPLQFYRFEFILIHLFFFSWNWTQAYQMTSSTTLPHGINSVPIVSPRNTSIPHPLPHHITGKNHGNSIFICNS